MHFIKRYNCKGIITLILFMSSVAVHAQTSNPKFDKALTDSLGADEYGMKMYVLVILKSGTNKTQEKVKLDSLFSGHMQNIKRLARDGKLVVAGPLQDNANQYRGLFILNVKTTEEVKALLQTDPANNVTDLQSDFLHTQFVALVNKKGDIVKIYDALKPSELKELVSDAKKALNE